MHHMRANWQMKRASASHSVSASDVRGKIQRRTCFSARTVANSPVHHVLCRRVMCVERFNGARALVPAHLVKSSGLGAQHRHLRQAPYARKQATAHVL